MGDDLGENSPPEGWGQALDMAAGLLVEEAARRVAAENALVAANGRVAQLETLLAEARSGTDTAARPLPPALVGLSAKPVGRTVPNPLPVSRAAIRGTNSRSQAAEATAPAQPASPRRISPRPFRSVSGMSVDELRSAADEWSDAARLAVQLTSPDSSPMERLRTLSASSSSASGLGRTPIARARQQPIPSALLRQELQAASARSLEALRQLRTASTVSSDSYGSVHVV